MPFLFPPLSPPRLHRTGRLAPGLVPERLRPGTSCHRHVSNQPGLPMPLKRQQWSWPAESGRMCGWSQRGRIMGCHRTAHLQRCRWLGMANSNKVVFINIYIYMYTHKHKKRGEYRWRKWQNTADAQNFISTPKDMVIHFRRESAAITLHKVYQHTHI